MRVTKAQWAKAPVCRNCYDYAADDYKIIQNDDTGEWVHIRTGKARCPGQGNDDTDDRAQPRIWAGEYVTSLDSRRSVDLKDWNEYWRAGNAAQPSTPAATTPTADQLRAAIVDIGEALSAIDDKLGALTCNEVDTIVRSLVIGGANDHAVAVLVGHSHADEKGDLHYKIGKAVTAGRHGNATDLARKYIRK